MPFRCPAESLYRHSREGGKRFSAAEWLIIQGLCFWALWAFGDKAKGFRLTASYLSLLVQRKVTQRKHTPPSRPQLCCGSAEPAGFFDATSCRGEKRRTSMYVAPSGFYPPSPPLRRGPGKSRSKAKSQSNITSNSNSNSNSNSKGKGKGKGKDCPGLHANHTASLATSSRANSKPSSSQPVMPPIMSLTGRPSMARRTAALSAPLQWGPAQYTTNRVSAG